jgi:cytochrome c553
MALFTALVFALFVSGDVQDVLAEPALLQDGERPPSIQGMRISGICPQNRKTRQAPSQNLTTKNPLPATVENLAKGKQLYNQDAKPTACKLCHGANGNGNGHLAKKLDPPPRNFTCAEVMQDLSDGQLFWVIKYGSRGTGMPAHKATLQSEEIWQIILYIKRFLRI